MNSMSSNIVLAVAVVLAGLAAVIGGLTRGI